MRQIGHSTSARRAAIHEPDTIGQRLADRIASGMGSWTFILAQTAIVVLWMLCNTLALALRWDAYPFILLNLLFSTQAAYAAPIIMMSQNRQAQKDHKRDDLEAGEVHLLYRINRQQLALLVLWPALAVGIVALSRRSPRRRGADR